MKEKLVKSINRLIWGRVVEIIFVVGLVLVTIPCWKSFESKISSAKITSLEDYTMAFRFNNDNNVDSLIAENPYYIHKNYKIYLEVDKNVDTKKAFIIINNHGYMLDDFYSINDATSKKFVIVDSNLLAGVDSYNVKLKFRENNTRYRYLFEENNIF